MSEYANPEVLVSTEWVAAHAKDSGMRLVEVDVDTSAYDQGHIEGAISWNWQTELQDAIRRDLSDPQAFETLLGKAGISPETTIVLYGDNNNWFAAWAFWQLKYYGHDKVVIMNGGRKKWIEEKRPVTNDKPQLNPAGYKVKTPNAAIRAKRDEVLRSSRKSLEHNWWTCVRRMNFPGRLSRLRECRKPHNAAATSLELPAYRGLRPSMKMARLRPRTL